MTENMNCSGELCPMQTGYKTKECNITDCCPCRTPITSQMKEFSDENSIKK